MTDSLFEDADLAIFEGLPFKFNRKPLALPPDQRLSWRLPLLLITLKYVRSSKASFTRLALATFALSNPSVLNELLIRPLIRLHGCGILDVSHAQIFAH
jgi:hypothetical protein